MGEPAVEARLVEYMVAHPQLQSLASFYRIFCLLCLLLCFEWIHTYAALYLFQWIIVHKFIVKYYFCSVLFEYQAYVVIFDMFIYLPFVVNQVVCLVLCQLVGLVVNLHQLLVVLPL